LIGANTRNFIPFREEYLRAVRDHPPHYLIESTETGSVVPNYGGLTDFPEFARFVTENYDLEQTVEHLKLFRRRGSF